MKRKGKRWASMLLAAVMLVLLVPAGAVSAAPLVVQDFVTIPGPDDRMAADYEFVPKFIAGVTSVEPFGPGWTELLTTSGDPDRIWYAYLPGVSGDGNISGDSVLTNRALAIVDSVIPNLGDYAGWLYAVSALLAASLLALTLVFWHSRRKDR